MEAVGRFVGGVVVILAVIALLILLAFGVGVVGSLVVDAFQSGWNLR